ncbi:MAG: hypothetical protein HY073_00280 [Deltaproteobacteria bacterium]|nr:hypothetical protein [Deltaproteobacteria bacterium]
MKLKSMPKELFVDVLDYLADYEHFEGLDKVLEGDHTVLDLRSAFRELSLYLRHEIEAEKGEKSLPNFQKDERFSIKVRELLSILSPGDERKLLDHFGLLDS